MSAMKIHKHQYKLIENYKGAFNLEDVEDKWADLFDKYDYILGDIGYDKLRLTGFYKRNKKGILAMKKSTAIQDYLMEYCNFNCPYFILKRLTTHDKDYDISLDEETTETNIEVEPLEQPESDQPLIQQNKTFNAYLKS